VIDVLEPLDPRVARDLIRRAVKTGTVAPSRHALDELKKDGLTMVDVENVLKGGVVDSPEWEKGEWRYRVRTSRVEVIVAFNSETDVAVVTAWRV
jgi:hypothetical protein